MEPVTKKPGSMGRPKCSLHAGVVLGSRQRLLIHFRGCEGLAEEEHPCADAQRNRQNDSKDGQTASEAHSQPRSPPRRKTLIGPHCLFSSLV
jgi:hypothetical protein